MNMKKIIAGAAIAAGYILFCRITRGYWNLSGDAVVIIMAAAACLLLRKALGDDQGKIDSTEPLYIRTARSSGGIEKGEKIG